MSRDLRRISVVAIALLVLVRVAIGWQFLYEGLWKLQSQSTATPWTARGYLVNAQGPFRDHFRSLAGDPDDLTWLDYDTVAQRWDDWKTAFAAHYKLTDAQKDQLEKMLNGDTAFVAALKELPASVRDDVDKEGRFGNSLSGVVWFDAERGRLMVDGKKHLQPDEFASLLKRAEVTGRTDAERAVQTELVKQYKKAVKQVFDRSRRHADHEVTGLSFKERLRASLLGDPERYGIVQSVPAAAPKDADRDAAAKDAPKEIQSNEDAQKESLVRLGRIGLYRENVREYNAAVATAQTHYQWDHLNYLNGKLQELKTEVVGPVKALDAELRDEAQLLLTPDQIGYGPVPLAKTTQQQLDVMTMWSLTIIGLLLIAGLATPLAALAGAGLLTMFYLVIPPWAGVPEIPGPEHSYIVNKNFIEALALLGIVFLPTGRWFGLDALVNWLWVKLTRRTPAPPEADKTVASLPKSIETAKPTATAR